MPRVMTDAKSKGTSTTVEDFEEDSKSALESSQIKCTQDATNNCTSDNDSVITDPKFDNYDLYEVVGDLSETILQQLSSKPDSKQLVGYKSVKDIMDLELLMAPSAVKMSELNNQSECNKEEKVSLHDPEHSPKKSLSACDLIVSPVLEKSMENFMSRACKLSPSNSVPGSIRNKKQPKRKLVTKQKYTKKPEIRKSADILPIKRKSLLEELTCPQKSLLSDLITPLDPITDNADFAKQIYDKDCMQTRFQDNETSACVKVNDSSQDCIKEMDCYDSGKKYDKEQDGLYNKVIDEKYKKKKSTNKKTCKTSSPSVVPFSTPEKVLVNEETQQKLSPQTVGSMKEVSTSENPIKDKYNNELESEKDKNALKETSGVFRDEYDPDPILMDVPCKNLDLEWNKENMKLIFGIDVPDEIINPETKTTGDEENNNSLSASSLSNSGMLNINPSTYEISTYKSHSSAEYLYYLHELAVARLKEQRAESTSKDTNNDNDKELPVPISENNDNKVTCTTRDTPTPQTSSYHQNEVFPAITVSKQRHDSQGQSADLKANEAPIESTSMGRIWTGHSGGYTVPNHTLNLTSYNNIPLNLHQNSTNLRQYDYLRSVQPPAIPRSGNPAMIPDSSAACNINSTVQPMAHYPNILNTQNWMMKPSGNTPLVQHLWQGFSAYGHYPPYRELAQRRVRLAQRAFLPHAATVNNYLNPAHTLMMNGCMRYGLYNRANAATAAMMAGMPYNLYPMTESSQHQPMHPVPSRLYPNFTGPTTAAAASHGTTMQPPLAKRRKLEEIVGRLKDTDKTT
ncbi:uncharacterized protein [Periplaneta americana]|uniref:uncharacterized protein n=1 Tax=Periplaneta americana TaxID=6978 RepID=UPI0037E8D6D4